MARTPSPEKFVHTDELRRLTFQWTWLRGFRNGHLAVLEEVYLGGAHRLPQELFCTQNFKDPLSIVTGLPKDRCPACMAIATQILTGKRLVLQRDPDGFFHNHVMPPA